MRIAHATDIHWFTPPTLGDLLGKRLIGSANLYLRGRRHRFDPVVQQALVSHLLSLAPDLVILSGDLTSQALDAEFELARTTLMPLLSTVPTFIVPGNHDAYTQAAFRGRSVERWFGDWMHLDGAIGRLDLGTVTVLGLDPNRPTFLNASGQLPQAQLTALAEALHSSDLAGRRVVLVLHYPLLDRHGVIYDGAHHGLRNAQALIDVIAAAPHRPQLVLCGHEHHGYQANLTLPDGTSIPIYDAGSSGQAYDPEHARTASMNLYDLDDSIELTRYQFDGSAFAAVPGGYEGDLR